MKVAMDMANETIPESAKSKDWSGLVSPSALEKPNNKVKRLSALTFDPDIQQRAGGTNPATVEKYAALIQDGVRFPRIKAVKEGDTFWVWDGFTRGEAYRLAGVEEIEIYYTIGTRRDAEFLSFSANADHGEQRAQGTTTRIIEKILADKTWGKVTAKAIAQHVGCGVRYVEKVAENLRNKGKPDALAGRADTRVVERGGKQVEVKARQAAPKSKTGGGVGDAGENGNGRYHDDDEGDATPATTAPRVTVDKLGNALERDDLVDVFTRAPILREYAKQLKAMRRDVTSAMGKDDKKIVDPLYAFLYRPGFMGDLDDAANVLALAEPYAVCPLHAADDLSREGCKSCRGLGWVGKQAYDHAVETTKAAAKVGK